MTASDAKLRYPAAAKMIGVSQDLLRKMVQAHTVPHYRIGPRTVVFSESELRAWLKARHVPVETREAG